MIDSFALRDTPQKLDIELRLSRSATSYHKRVKGTFYIDEACFSIFVNSFSANVASDNKFNTYGQTKFRKHELVNVRQSLSKFSLLNNINSAQELEMFLAPHFGQVICAELNLEHTWDKILDELIKTQRDLIQLVQKTIRENSVLWILGL